MIKFFRHIRRSLIQENKTGKYFKYAIGEIFLVMIGILLALQVNNWNESNRNQRETTDYLERLSTEIDLYIGKVNKEIEIDKNQIHASKELLNLFHQERKHLKSKTLDSLIFTVFGANTIDINLGIFNEGVNGGKIGNIKSEKLRTALYGFIGLIEDLKRKELMWNEDLNKNLGGFLNENFNYREMDNTFSRYKGEIGNSNFKDFNNLSILSSMEFENHIDNRFFLNRMQLENYQKVNLELKKIDSLISGELKI